MSMSWKLVGEGPKWLPILTDVEVALNIPPGLLARMAFQESSFRPEIIDGTKPSSAGALGILQMLPKYFDCVCRPIPFSNDTVRTQIIRAGQYLVQLHTRFGDWAEALAAYNFGPGNEQKYLDHKISGLPQENVNYVTEILADVPIPNIPQVPA